MWFFCLFWRENVLRAITAYFFNIRISKSGTNILTWKCVSRYNGVYFYILIFKSGPRMMGFAYFDLEMYFAVQRF